MNKQIERGGQPPVEERVLKAASGMGVLFLNTLLVLAGVGGFVLGIALEIAWPAILGGIYAFLIGPTLYLGLKVLKPQEALVLTLFGEYHGTLKGPGFYFVNPFVSALNPATTDTSSGSLTSDQMVSLSTSKNGESNIQIGHRSKKISLKAMTLNNDRQKINDQQGNPIIIGIVVIWRVVDTAKAVFSVDNYPEFLSIQCDSALRNIVRLYPYDAPNEADYEKSLRGGSQEIADHLQQEIQTKVDAAGLEILEARITNLSYAPEIAAAMLQRQQASAVVDARQMIVDGAVGMVEMALNRLNENDIVHLDEERKAAMVSNLLVVLCGNKDAQPIVNSGSLY